MEKEMSRAVLAWQDGRVVPADTLRIDPRDLGLLRGYAFFDVLPVVWGVPLFWERHYRRMAGSARELRLVLPVDEAGFRAALGELIGAFGTEAIIRTVCTGGPSRDGFTPEPGRETFCLLAEPAHPYPENIYTEGVKLITTEYARALPQVKFPNHALAIHALPERIERGAFDLLYVIDNAVSEAAQGNILVVKDDRIVSSREEALPGIVQAVAMELARQGGFRIEWRPVSLAETLAADEVLLTGSSKGIVPVTMIDDRVIGSGVPGPVVQKLRTAYARAVEEYRTAYLREQHAKE